MTDYVIDGQWDDVQWREIAAKHDRTPAEVQVFASGPRSHPFGPLAFIRVMPDGRCLVFPTQQAFSAWAGTVEGEDALTDPLQVGSTPLPSGDDDHHE